MISSGLNASTAAKVLGPIEPSAGTPATSCSHFAAWSNENLANFAKDSYLRMQQQQDAIMQLRGDLKDAMVELRKQAGDRLNMGNSVAPALAKG